jgi:hypothetical protein
LNAATRSDRCDLRHIDWNLATKRSPTTKKLFRESEFGGTILVQAHCWTKRAVQLIPTPSHGTRSSPRPLAHGRVSCVWNHFASSEFQDQRGPIPITLGPAQPRPLDSIRAGVFCAYSGSVFGRAQFPACGAFPSATAAHAYGERSLSTRTRIAETSAVRPPFFSGTISDQAHR